MNALSSVPFFRPTLALIFGIGSGLYFDIAGMQELQGVYLLLLVAVFLSVLFHFTQGFAKSGVWRGFFSMLSIALIGVLLSYHAQSIHAVSFFNRAVFKETVNAKLRLTDELTAKANSWRCKAQVLEILDSQSNPIKVTGNVLVYWPQRSNPQKPKLTYGDEIWIAGSILEMPSAAFPEDFDFKAVMRYQDVQHQLFLSEGSWRRVGNSASPLYQLSFNIRNSLVAKFANMFKPRTAAMMSSLLLGYRQEMDKESVAAFSSTGTMHVLAVSGLHVGLIYLLLVLLLAGKRRVAKLNILQASAVILLLWFFALVTGLSPSVVRACAMFTIIEIGRSILYRQSNLLNSLFTAAFVQLLFQPLNLIDAGFQLSYLAVAGIAIVYPRFIEWYQPGNRIANYVYQMSALSVSATISTLPVTLYYFHTFPVWFIPANLIAVPLSSLLIYMGMLCLVLSKVLWLGEALVWLTQHCMDVFTGSVSFFSKLPGATIQGLFITVLEAMAISIVLMSLIIKGVVGTLKMYIYMIVGLVLFGAQGWYDWHLRQGSGKWIVCELKGNMLCAHHYGNQLKVYSSTLRKGQADSLGTYLMSYVTKYKIKEVAWTMIDSGYFEFGQVNQNNKSPVIAVFRKDISLPAHFNGKVFCRMRDESEMNIHSQNVCTVRNTFLIID
jgi:competence protein ComEC